MFRRSRTERRSSAEPARACTLAPGGARDKGKIRAPTPISRSRGSGQQHGAPGVLARLRARPEEVEARRDPPAGVVPTVPRDLLARDQELPDPAPAHIEDVQRDGL